MTKKLLAAAMLAALAGCHGRQPSGDLSADESRQLNEAAAMLDDNVEMVPASEDAAANGDINAGVPAADTNR